MRKIEHKALLLIIIFGSFFFSSCISPRKMDKHVSQHFGDQIPKLRRSVSDITVTSNLITKSTEISNTVKKTSEVVPLVFYWSFDYRHTCKLNPEIPVNNFTNTINTTAGKLLRQKIEGKQLKLNVEEVPTAFALVDKAKLVWVIAYVIDWHNIYVEPDFKDLVVSYQLIENNETLKTGKIAIKSQAKNKGIRFAQPWRSTTSEYLIEYNAAITNMTKEFIDKLIEEI